MMQASCSRLDAARWHFQHGPIDLIITVDGKADAIARALDSAWSRFQQVLPELVDELALLRQAVRSDRAFEGAVAKRMQAACWPHRAQFITPMAAVAGSVADEMIEFFSCEPDIQRAAINNGGDIALHLQANESYRIGLVTDIAQFSAQPDVVDGSLVICAADPVRGIATSGWRGRSLSLGIADSVTALASSAAHADAAATMIANAVNVEHAAIRRAPAHTVKDDTDLGSLLVTQAVGVLPPVLVQQALERGKLQAQRLLMQGHIQGALLVLQTQACAVGQLEQRSLLAA
jgi:ApbE superfamily uncharacterized protein (UPF0280 family)